MWFAFYVYSKVGKSACVMNHNLGKQSGQLDYTNNSSQKYTKYNKSDLIFLQCWMQYIFELCRILVIIVVAISRVSCVYLYITHR